MDNNIVWFDIPSNFAEGKGWADTLQPFDRLPAKAEAIVTKDVWSHSRTTPGICVHFNTNSPEIHARWKMGREQLGEDNFNIMSCSGIDLYCHDGKSWRWAATTPHFQVKDTEPQVRVIDGLSRVSRRYRVYFPQRNELLKLEIGVEDGAEFTMIAPCETPPMVYYGTSIVHGAFTARSGLGCPQMIARELDIPLINLGFSGSAKMEAELAELIAELNAKMFLIDPLANMDARLVKERAEKFTRILCEKQPETPVFLIQNPMTFNAWMKEESVNAYHEKINAFRQIFSRLKAEGFRQLFYIDASGFYGQDNDASTDYIHPNDLGHKRMSDGLTAAINAVLSKR